MMVVMAINLYAVRVVLAALGAVDFGIFDVVTGVVLLLSSGISVLSAATQRYFALALADPGSDRFTQVFSTSVQLFTALAVGVFVIGEAIGPWFIREFLVIPQARLPVALQIFQLSLLMTVVTIAQTPFSCAIISHEDLGIYSVISMGESALKLFAAMAITRFSSDALLFHGTALLIINTLVAMAYVRIALRHYPHCRYRSPVDRSLIHELFAFAGWLFFGALASAGLMQGISILVNIFFGPAVGAARALSLQLNNAISIFTGSLVMAARPAMIRAYGERSFNELNRVFNGSNKFILFGLVVICVPLIVEMRMVLSLWLGVPDANTVHFAQLTVVYAFIMAFNNPISAIIQAAGRVKEYHVVVESFTLTAVPVTYLLFTSGYPVTSSYAAMIGSAVAAHGARLWCLQRYYAGFRLKCHLVNFVRPAAIIIGVVSLGAYGIRAALSESLVRAGLQFLLAGALTLLLGLSIGLTAGERDLLRKMVRRFRTAGHGRGPISGMT